VYGQITEIHPAVRRGLWIGFKPYITGMVRRLILRTFSLGFSPQRAWTDRHTDLVVNVRMEATHDVRLEHNV